MIRLYLMFAHLIGLISDFTKSNYEKESLSLVSVTLTKKGSPNPKDLSVIFLS